MMNKSVVLGGLAKCIDEGWMPNFIEAGINYSFAPAILLAIASRESDFRNIVGDSGHGYGLMQIDLRSDREAAKYGLVPEWNIDRGAKMLKEKQEWIENHGGEKLTLKDSTGKSAVFTVPSVYTPDILLKLAVASYNVGAWAVYHYANGRSPDQTTTGGNYSTDVLVRTELIGEWLNKNYWSMKKYEVWMEKRAKIKQ